MKIEIQGITYIFHFGFKSFLLFEGVNGRSFEGASLTDEITMMLCCILAGNSDSNLVVDDLVAVLDESPELLTEWRLWFGERVERQASRMQLPNSDDSKKKA